MKDVYTLHLLISIFTWAIVAANWNIMIGYSGVFHYAQIALFSIGAYTTAILSLRGISPWIGLFIGGLTAALTSILLGWPLIKVKGIYLILLSFAFHYLLLSSIFNFRTFTGGSQGLVGLPTFSLEIYVFKTTEKAPYYYLALILLLVSYFIHKKIINCPIGKALQAFRDCEKLAISLGINPSKYIILIFTICSFLTGLIGAFFAHYLQFVDPTYLSFENILTALAMIVVGGLGTVEGPIIGSFILILLSEYLRGIEVYRQIIKSLLLIIMLIFAPKGMMGIHVGFSFSNFAKKIIKKFHPP
jgi:branched-chain amino acid transport system permease protein